MNILTSPYHSLQLTWRMFLEMLRKWSGVGTVGFTSPKKNHVTPNPRGIYATINNFSMIGCKK